MEHRLARAGPRTGRRKLVPDRWAEGGAVCGSDSDDDLEDAEGEADRSHGRQAALARRARGRGRRWILMGRSSESGLPAGWDSIRGLEAKALTRSLDL